MKRCVMCLTFALTLFLSPPVAEASSLIPVSSTQGFDLYYAAEILSGDTSYDCLQAGIAPDNTNLRINKNGTATLTMRGTATTMKFADGKVSAWGKELYTYELIGADEIRLDMQGMVYRFLKEGSAAAQAAGLVAGATAHEAAATEYTPRIGEIAYEFDGNRCYYKVIESTEGPTVYIRWLYADTDDLYIPAEIEGMTVTRFGNLEGHAKNLYIPGTIKYIGYRICSEVWSISGIEQVFFGYGDYPATDYIDVLHFIDNDEKVERITFSDCLDKDHERWMAMSILGAGDFPNIQEVVNMTETWKYGLEGNEALLSLMAEKDPADYLHPQSAKVTRLAKRLTARCKTDEEKLYAISEWICENISYDYYELWGGRARDRMDDYGNRFEREQEPEDLIDNRIGVCEGYAKLTAALCNAAGIPAAYVSGVTQESRHAWNVIYVNGTWGIYDNTANDSDYNADLSLRTPEEFFSGLITYDRYMANEELREDYTWEEICDMNEAYAQGKHFADDHPYWNGDPLHMGTSAIPEYVDGEEIPYEHPDLTEFMSAQGRAAAGSY